MLLTIANLISWAFTIYVVLGVLCAIPFVWRGVGKIDPVAAEGTWGFRILIFPGVVALWPLLLLRWARGTQPPEEKNAHRVAARRRTG